MFGNKLSGKKTLQNSTTGITRVVSCLAVYKILLQSFTMTTHAEIEAQIREIQQRKKEEKEADDVGLGASGFFDQDIYNGAGKYEGYVTSIAPNDEYDVSVTIIL